MEKTSTNLGWPQLEAAEPEHDSDRLLMAIAEMQSIASISLDQIAAIGKLALIALETPLKTAAQRETIAQGILAMIEKAQMTSDHVSYEAENVGVRYSDEAKLRRAAALPS